MEVKLFLLATLVWFSTVVLILSAQELSRGRWLVPVAMALLGLCGLALFFAVMVWGL